MAILTAGYGNRGFDGFIELMKRHEVTHLVDVRSVPQSSYWEDFRRPRLERLVPTVGLRYVYMGDTLGGVPSIPDDPVISPERDPIFCKTDPSCFKMEPLFADPKFRLGLRKLVEASEMPGRRFCLLCGCLRPHKCHRFRLIGEALDTEGIEVLHLSDKGEAVPHEQVRREAAPSQTSLF